MGGSSAAGELSVFWAKFSSSSERRKERGKPAEATATWTHCMAVGMAGAQASGWAYHAGGKTGLERQSAMWIGV